MCESDHSHEENFVQTEARGRDRGDEGTKPVNTQVWEFTSTFLTLRKCMNFLSKANFSLEKVKNELEAQWIFKCLI